MQSECAACNRLHAADSRPPGGFFLHRVLLFPLPFFFSSLSLFCPVCVHSGFCPFLAGSFSQVLPLFHPAPSRACCADTRKRKNNTRRECVGRVSVVSLFRGPSCSFLLFLFSLRFRTLRVFTRLVFRLVSITCSRPLSVEDPDATVCRLLLSLCISAATAEGFLLVPPQWEDRGVFRQGKGRIASVEGIERKALLSVLLSSSRFLSSPLMSLLSTPLISSTRSYALSTLSFCSPFFFSFHAPFLPGSSSSLPSTLSFSFTFRATLCSGPLCHEVHAHQRVSSCNITPSKEVSRSVCLMRSPPRSSSPPAFSSFFSSFASPLFFCFHSSSPTSSLLFSTAVLSLFLLLPPKRHLSSSFLSSSPSCSSSRLSCPSSLSPRTRARPSTSQRDLAGEEPTQTRRSTCLLSRPSSLLANRSFLRLQRKSVKSNKVDSWLGSLSAIHKRDITMDASSCSPVAEGKGGGWENKMKGGEHRQHRSATREKTFPVTQEDLPLGLDPFCFRHWEEDAPHAASTRLGHSISKEDFLQRVNRLLSSEEGKDLQFHEGYAPFCRHLFIPNFTQTHADVLPITPENEAFLRSGYLRRRPEELPVLTRWFPSKTLPQSLPSHVQNRIPAKYLDLILYSREQLAKEEAAMRRNDGPQGDKKEHADETVGDGSNRPKWSIISIKAQDENFEIPMAPITMLRNTLIEEGGSGVALDRESYEASVEYWRTHAIVMDVDTGLSETKN